MLVSIILIVSYNFYLIRLIARTVFSPASPGLRIVPISDENSRFLYNWIILITVVALIIAALSRILTRTQISQGHSIFLITYAASGVSIIALIIIMIWQSRQKVAQAIAGSDHLEPDQLQAKIAGKWHWFGMLYVAVTGIIWEMNLFVGKPVTILKLIISLFFIPIFFAVDYWVQRLLNIASGTPSEIIDLNETDVLEAEGEKVHQPAIKNYASPIRKTFRAILFLFFIFLGMRLWGIDFAFGRYFTSHIIGIAMTLLIGLAVWEYTKARIDEKIKNEMPDTEDLEEGGVGGSRIGTLLMLLRKFILAVLVIIIAMIVLSALGLNIGPLIASAGVIGLAIGFGAQKLVQDIISGIFFLIDDAFRVGDYIETSGIKGMVEHISLRSLKLRHPRGMLHNIPYGSMVTLTNFSRDYIITKLDIRVRYDTDVDKVRKIVKKIYKKLSEDEKIGSVLLGKIKSQGVREMDDSAMIMRVKFKTIPGEQFIVRREVYRLIQEGFRENGIEFAHRNVTVYLPPEQSEEKEKIAKSAAAAAVAAQDKQSSP